MHNSGQAEIPSHDRTARVSSVPLTFPSTHLDLTPAVFLQEGHRFTSIYPASVTLSDTATQSYKRYCCLWSGSRALLKWDEFLFKVMFGFQSSPC